MSARENAIRFVEESVAAENAQDYDGMYSVFTRELTYHLNGKVLASGRTDRLREAEKRTTPGIYGNAHREIQWIDATDTRVVYQYRISFNHDGDVFGFPPTGNRVEFHAVAIYEHDGTAVSTIRLFADQVEMDRQLSGKPGRAATASAALEGPPIPWAERARFEAIGERLARKVYESEAARDVDGYVGCYADPFLDHANGHASTVPLERLRSGTLMAWDPTPRLGRTVEEVINTGNRTTLRWHLEALNSEGREVSQYGCSVFEHNGQAIVRSWAYYPDVFEVFPVFKPFARERDR